MSDQPDFPPVYDIQTDTLRPMTGDERAAFRPFMFPRATEPKKDTVNAK